MLRSQPDSPSPVELFLGRHLCLPRRPNLAPFNHKNITIPNSPVQSPIILAPKYKVGDMVKSRWPPALIQKGHSPNGTPLTITKVLGPYVFELSDKQIWNAQSLRPVIVTPTPTYTNPMFVPPHCSQCSNLGKLPVSYSLPFCKGGDDIYAVSCFLY